MDNAVKNRLRKIISLAYKQNWSDKKFSLEKAHVCAELSSIVYEDVQEYEIKKASRIHLFASDAYKKIVSSGKSNAIFSNFDEVNLEASFFVVRGRYAVILGMCFDDVIILTVRGTVFRKLWDWKANVDSKKFFVKYADYFNPFGLRTFEFEDQFFHKGFFESIVPQFPSIFDEVRKNTASKKEIKIVWTGHSLGGAMAAIGNALFQTVTVDSDRKMLVTTDAYTFGMPRYCGLGTICKFPGPHHIYKKKDIIPTIPTRKMGFSDCCREYEVTDSGKVELSERTDTFGVVGHIPKLVSSIQAHSIEGYANSMAGALGVQRP